MTVPYLLLMTLIGFSGITCRETPSTNCTDYVPEKKDLHCQCLAPKGMASSTLTWPGHSDGPDLVQKNVQREDNDTQFTCQMETDGVKTTTQYTLLVAHGPSEENVQINFNHAVNVVDGSQRFELTCVATDVYPSPSLTWDDVTCDNGGQSSVCTFTPRLGQDHVLPTCIAKRPYIDGYKNKIVSKTKRVGLSYPPLSRPDIRPHPALLRTGDVLTCDVVGGNPLVHSVHFACTDPQLDDQPDVINGTSVSSSVTVNAAHASEKDMKCSCHATWKPRPEYYRLSTTAIFSVKHKVVIMSLQLNNTDDEITVNGTNNTSVSLVCGAFGRPPPAVINFTYPAGDIHPTNTIVSQTANWTSRADVTLSDIQCQDMGTYSCTAHNGLGHPDTRSIILNVRCPPQKTFNETLNMTERGVFFTLQAFPAPDTFAYTYLGEDTRSKGTSVLSDNFHSTCQQDRVNAYMVQCGIRPVNVPKRLLGFYRVDVSNGIGSVEVAFQIRIEVLRGKSTSTGLIVGCVIIVIIVILVVVVAVLLVNKRRRCMRRRLRKSTGKANHAADNNQYISPEQVPMAATTQASNRSTQSQAIDVSRYRIDPSTNSGNYERVSTMCAEGSSRAAPIDVEPSADVACTSADVNVDCTNIAGERESSIVSNSQDKSASKGDNDTVKEPKDNGSSNGNHDMEKGKTDNSAPKADNGTPKDKDVSNDTTDNGASKGENGTAKRTNVSPSSNKKSPINNNDISPACTSRPEEPQSQPKVHDYANEEPVYSEIDDALPAPALTRKQGKVEALYAVSPCYGTPGYKDTKSPGHVNYQEPLKLTTMDAETNRGSPTGGDLSTSTRLPQLPTKTAMLAPGSEGDTYDIAREQRPTSDRDDTYSHID